MQMTELASRFCAEAQARLNLELSNGGMVGVACSGGIDSLALLYALHHAYPSHRHQLCVLHFDHNTRNGESAKDAEFVVQTAAQLGLNCHCGKRDTANEATEAELREGRLNFFHNTLTHLNSQTLVTGHHAEDVAETLLMRILRGSGIEGLAAPRPVQIHGSFVHLRPLLNVRKAELRTALETAGIAWREDTSNTKATYLRNRIRHQILPALNGLGEHDFIQGANRSRARIEECDAAIDWSAAQLLNRMDTQAGLPASLLSGVPQGIVRRVLEHWLTAQGIRACFEASAFDTCLKAFIAGTQFAHPFAPDQRLDFDGQVLTQVKIPQSVTLEVMHTPLPLVLEGAVHFPQGTWLTLTHTLLDTATRDAILTGHYSESEDAWLCPHALGGLECLYIRHWLAGDRYHPLGTQGRKKLQDCFIDKKIPLIQRRQLPVILNGQSDILWVPGLPPANPYSLNTYSTHALRLTYRTKCLHNPQQH